MPNSAVLQIRKSTICSFGIFLNMNQNNVENKLFDDNILADLNFSKFESHFKPSINVTNPGSGLIIRSLQSSDYHAGFTQLLGQLTSVGEVAHNEFLDRFRSMKQCPDSYFITVVEDVDSGQVVGAASLILEQKFIHRCALRGRIEDVVVCDKYRGKQLGKLLIATLVLLAEHLKVYKLTLDCKDHMVSFYQAFGFDKENGNSNYMQIRFKM